MVDEPGLRERKKAQTRQLIAEAARRLFAERGFDAVPVAEVAGAAGVSEKTVFNYFPTKEDLFYSGLEAFEDELLGAIRARAPGTSVVAAFRDFLLKRRGLYDLAARGGDDEATRRLRTMSRVISESPALLARERQVFDRYTDSLAALIGESVGAKPGDVEPRAVAAALLAVHRSLVEYSRRRAVEGARPSRVGRELRAQGERAFARLEQGLGDYGVPRG